MKKFILLLYITLNFIPFWVSAYSPTTTHAGLTEQIVEFYNLTNVRAISKDEKELIIKGAIDEDSPESRVLNHFYDPVRNIGINGGVTSKRWASDETIVGNEYSWQKSIDSYARGDEKSALVGLGHILHLIEDASVPEHTRNDPHIGDGLSGGFTNESPFENWTDMNKNRSTLSGLANKFFNEGLPVIKKNSLGAYFDFIALYSNNNFFSQDTIENKVYQYDKPEIVEYDDYYGYAVDLITGGKYKIVLKEKVDNTTFRLSLINKIDNDTSVLSSYFDRLSKQAVLIGVGVIELFFKEAEEARLLYEKQEHLRREKEEKDAEAMSKELSSKGTFGLIWKGMGFLVMDNIVYPISKVASTVTKKISSGTLATAQTVSNAVKIGSFSVGTASSIAINKAEEFAGEVVDGARGGVAAARTFVQKALDREVADVVSNGASVLFSSNSTQLSQNELKKLGEILNKAREDVIKMQNEVLAIDANNKNNLVVIASDLGQGGGGLGNANNTNEDSQSQETPKYALNSYVAGFGGGGGGTPTQKFVQETVEETESEKSEEMEKTEEAGDEKKDEKEGSKEESTNTGDSEKSATATAKSESDDSLKAPIVTSPSDFSVTFATTTITFTGVSPSGWDVEATYQRSSTLATTTVTASTTAELLWSMDLSFDIGTTTISFTAIGDDGARSSGAEITLNISFDDKGDLEEEKEESDAIFPEAPKITSPLNGAILTTTSILFSGTASTTNIISTDFSSTTKAVDENGAWEMLLSDFPQGTTTVSFFASDTNGATSSEATIDVFVDSIPPEAPKIVVSECAYTITVDKDVCIIPTADTLNIFWSSSSDDVEYYVTDTSWDYSTTTATSTRITILEEGYIEDDRDDEEYEIMITAIDKAGNASVRSRKDVEIIVSPVVINEIAWAGTKASSTDEWIELANTTSHAISLSGMNLYSDDGSPNIVFTDTDIIDSLGQYLIERKTGDETDEATQSPVVDVVADMWTSFGRGLKNTGEVLYLSLFSALQKDQSGGPLILDKTPDVSVCLGWCGGSAAPDYVSMERARRHYNGESRNTWVRNDMFFDVTLYNGTDVGGNPINGTPRERSSSKLIKRIFRISEF